MGTSVKPQSFTRPKYRADIDGMRAIAILSVLFFHAFPSSIPGGFIGVDIFFVISGYLISSIIFRGLQHNTFSFFDFYARRVRRIFPAVAVVILGSFILGFFLLTSYEYEELVRESPYAAFFLENWRLYKETGGYWDIGTELKPYMHFWSLGVEEQYYIFYPLICFVLWKFSKKAFLGGLLFMFAVSFGLCLYDTVNEPIRAFYSLHSRFWELLVGGILAYVELQWPDFKENNRFAFFKDNLLSFLGMVFIFTALVVFKEGGGFPGWRALFPTIGAVLIICAGERAWINKYILSNKAFVFIGLISYPLYLWHWIFICIFRNNLEGQLPTGGLMWVLIGASVLMAYLTYILIERPMRSLKASWKLVGVLTIALLLVTIGHKTLLRKSATLQAFVYGGTSVQQIRDIRHSPHVDPVDSVCESKFGKNFLVCRATTSHPNTVIYGDSHNHLMWKYLHGKTGLPSFYLVGADAEVVFEGVYSKGADKSVLERNLAFWKAIRTSPEIKTVVLRGFWSGYYDRELERYLPSGKVEDISGKEAIERLWRELFAEMKSLGKDVILVLDNVVVDFDPVKRCLAVQRVTLKPKPGDECILPYKDIVQINYDSRDFLIREAKKWQNVKIIDSWDILCNDKGCYLAKGEVPYYQDSNHLSPYGNELLWPLLEKAIKIGR